MDITQVWRAYTKDADPDAVLAMVKQCDPQAVSSDGGGVNLLHLACRNAHPEALEYLLAQGLDPNEPPRSYGAAPIFSLAQKSHSGGYLPRPGDIYKCASALLEARASTLRKDESDKLSYHYAASTEITNFCRPFWIRTSN